MIKVSPAKPIAFLPPVPARILLGGRGGDSSAFVPVLGGLAVSAVAVLTALAERDAAIAVAEQAAATSIAAMMAEGLSLSEVADWCGGLEVREVARLSRIEPKAVAS